MDACPTPKIELQRTGQPLATSILEWLERRIEARRARRADARRRQDPALLDRAALAEIGVNPIADGEFLHSIVGLNPHIIAVDIIAGNRFAQ